MSRPAVDTIAALSSAPGRAAVSLIRISGPQTFLILEKVFRPSKKSKFVKAFSVTYGEIIDPSTSFVADKVLVSTFPGPASYTGEDCAEIGLHGNPAIVSQVLGILCSTGVRSAEPGEFTRRAFINGKMDLLEIEALSQLLSAETDAQTRLALNQLDGLPSRHLTKIRNRLADLLVQLEASLNFPEDAIESVDVSVLQKELCSICSDLEHFQKNADRGRLISSGLKIALAGKPNTGKSSLLNTMLGRDRAIVSDIPGTTRDTLEETLQIASVPIKIIDTAGIRTTGDTIEVIGVKKAKEAFDKAFAIIALFDGSEPLSDEDKKLYTDLCLIDKPLIVAINKSDLELKADLSFFDKHDTVFVSTLDSKGLTELTAVLEHIIAESGMQSLEHMIIMGTRQLNALQSAIEAAKRARDGAQELYQDMLALELQEAVTELGRITGENVDFNALDLIFERFCIGK